MSFTFLRRDGQRRRCRLGHAGADGERLPVLVEVMVAQKAAVAGVDVTSRWRHICL